MKWRREEGKKREDGKGKERKKKWERVDRKRMKGTKKWASGLKLPNGDGRANWHTLWSGKPTHAVVTLQSSLEG